MASEKQKSMIRIDYQVLRETKARDGHVHVRLVKKARRLFGRAAREEILRIMDPLLRVQAGEIAERHVTPSRSMKSDSRPYWKPSSYIALGSRRILANSP